MLNCKYTYFFLKGCNKFAFMIVKKFYNYIINITYMKNIL